MEGNSQPNRSHPLPCIGTPSIAPSHRGFAPFWGAAFPVWEAPPGAAACGETEAQFPNRLRDRMRTASAGQRGGGGGGGHQPRPPGAEPSPAPGRSRRSSTRRSGERRIPGQPRPGSGMSFPRPLRRSVSLSPARTLRLVVLGQSAVGKTGRTGLPGIPSVSPASLWHPPSTSLASSCIPLLCPGTPLESPWPPPSIPPIFSLPARGTNLPMSLRKPGRGTFSRCPPNRWGLRALSFLPLGFPTWTLCTRARFPCPRGLQLRGGPGWTSLTGRAFLKARLGIGFSRV